MRGYKKHNKPLKDFMCGEFERILQTHDIKTDWRNNTLYFRTKRNKATDSGQLSKLATRKGLRTKQFTNNKARQKASLSVADLKKFVFVLMTLGILLCASAWTNMEISSPIVAQGISRVDSASYTYEEIKRSENPIHEEINKVFGDHAEQAFKCLESENRNLNPKAINWNNNGTFDVGIFQVNQIHCGGRLKHKNFNADECREYLENPYNNIQVAYSIFSQRGWNAWYGSTCRPYWK